MRTAFLRLHMGCAARTAVLLLLCSITAVTGSQWAKITPKTQFMGGVVQPEKRTGMSCTAIGSTMYMMSGQGMGGRTDLYADTYSFETSA